MARLNFKDYIPTLKTTRRAKTMANAFMSDDFLDFFDETVEEDPDPEFFPAPKDRVIDQEFLFEREIGFRHVSS